MSQEAEVRWLQLLAGGHPDAQVFGIEMKREKGGGEPLAVPIMSLGREGLAPSLRSRGGFLGAHDSL